MEAIKKYVEEQNRLNMNQDDIRERLFKARRANPRSWKTVSLEMDLSLTALKAFAQESRDAAPVTLMKIENWIINQEGNK